MERFKADAIIFFAVLLLAFAVLLLIAGQSNIDIQLHDTYFVVDKVSLMVLIIGPLTFTIFLVRGLKRKFNTKGANIGLIVGLALICLVTYQVVRVQQSYVSEVVQFEQEGQPDRGQFIADAKNNMAWTWGLLGLWLTALFFLTLRTIKIWKR